MYPLPDNHGKIENIPTVHSRLTAYEQFMMSYKHLDKLQLEMFGQLSRRNPNWYRYNNRPKPSGEMELDGL